MGICQFVAFVQPTFVCNSTSGSRLMFIRSIAPITKDRLKDIMNAWVKHRSPKIKSSYADHFHRILGIQSEFKKYII